MRSTLKRVREGDLVAEVSVQLLDHAGPWSPVLSVDDATGWTKFAWPFAIATFDALRTSHSTCTV
jgi:hypothetical protein